MSTVRIVCDRTKPVSKELQEALNKHLSTIGFKVIGIRGERELVIRVDNRELVPKENFRACLRKILDNADVWKHFDSVSFN